jgi:hypothetical protein
MTGPIYREMQEDLHHNMPELHGKAVVTSCLGNAKPAVNIIASSHTQVLWSM